eukprot:4848282-Pleurochrysis_carterae.AAC.1
MSDSLTCSTAKGCCCCSWCAEPCCALSVCSRACSSREHSASAAISWPSDSRSAESARMSPPLPRLALWARSCATSAESRLCLKTTAACISVSTLFISSAHACRAPRLNGSRM